MENDQGAGTMVMSRGAEGALSENQRSHFPPAGRRKIPAPEKLDFRNFGQNITAVGGETYMKLDENDKWQYLKPSNWVW